MKIGLIGCGNLGSSLLRGLLKTGAEKADEVIVADMDKKKLELLRKLGIKTTKDNKKAAEADIIFIAVRPGLVGEILDEMREVSKGKLIVSVAAGVSTKFIEDRTDARVIRVMPNICALAAEMASCFCPGTKASKEDEELVKGLLSGLGMTFKVEEEMMDAVTGLSGSGPAYFYSMIKALKEVGIELGLSEDVALKLAAQTAKGAGEMVIRSGRSLDELTDMVCSPKGATVEGLKVLKSQKVPESFKEAVKAAAKRSKELSR
ncbi:MAG: pyrroline-5-carboxylate reductase [Candidatus Hadarchaeota archaeon]|nr:pyrroline-5-carboxylate reductase [Candidatus Hadarchaeota archaeon]